jgi:colicin import membrane protein
MTPDLPQTIAIGRPDPVLIDSADRFLISAKASYAVIATPDEYEAAGLDLQSVKSAQKALEAARTKVTVPLNQVVKAVNELFKKPAEALDQAEAIIKRGMLAYTVKAEQERRAQEAAIAEANRKEQERLEEQARKAAASGKTAKADSLLERAAAIPQSVEIASVVPRISGQSVRSLWRAEITDKLALLQYVVAHPEWLHLVEANEKVLNKMAGPTLAIPGVKAVEERILASRSA